MSETDQKTVEALKKAFSLSCAVFEFTRNAQTILSGIKPTQTYMHTLHLQMVEVLKHNPVDAEMVDKILESMEDLTEENEKQENEKQEN